MKTQIKYQVLKYVHSQFLEEKVNVGILFYAKETGLFYFRRPKNFKRINELYSDFEEWQLKNHLSAIEEKINLINSKKTELFSNDLLKENYLEEILRTDGTVLQFSRPRLIIENLDNIEHLIRNYYDLYFSNYKVDSRRQKHDEEYLLKNFKEKLTSKKSSIQNFLKKDIIIISPRTNVKFEYSWRNDLDHLVKPISFDLEEENKINNKAILFYGQLNFISQEIIENNYSVDLLISGPSLENENSKLQRAYENAIGILNEVNIKNKTIVSEKEVDRYAENVVSYIRKD